MDLFCPHCRLQQPRAHRYCIQCGALLPSHLLGEAPHKQVRMFPGIKVSDDDLDPGYLRVSVYLKEQLFDAPEGSVTIPGHHVRFSIWDREKARCVLSIPETEARDAASFILTELDRLNGRAGADLTG